MPLRISARTRSLYHRQTDRENWVVVENRGGTVARAGYFDEYHEHGARRLVADMNLRAKTLGIQTRYLAVPVSEAEMCFELIQHHRLGHVMDWRPETLIPEDFYQV